MKNSLECHLGFTLIELLVVVLIIGVLAAIALPQYQKAVLKSRLVKWTAVLDAFRKNIDMYHLANGWPDATVFFSGTIGEGNCDISVPCDSVDNRYCYLENPDIFVLASGGTTNGVGIQFFVNGAWPGSTGRIIIDFVKDATGQWFAVSERTIHKTLCQWVKDLGYPGHESIVSQCAELGVTIPPYNE